MTPLEVAAKAEFETGGLRKWEDASYWMRKECIEDMRAVLLALADRLETEPDSDACIVKLRAIANGDIGVLW